MRRVGSLIATTKTFILVDLNEMSIGANREKSKPERRYDATGRRERARRQHEAPLAAAEGLFFERGYAATTVESIARAAKVSEATIYKSYGGKAGLVRELCARA